MTSALVSVEIGGGRQRLVTILGAVMLVMVAAAVVARFGELGARLVDA